MLLDIFDENLHPLSVTLPLGPRVWSSLFPWLLWAASHWECLPPQKSEVPADYDKHNPEQKQIYRFVRTLFSAAQLTAECAIVTLVSARGVQVGRPPETGSPALPRGSFNQGSHCVSQKRACGLFRSPT